MTTTQPSARSAPSLYLGNWRDIVAIWESRRLTQTDTQPRGPGLAELHYLGGRASTWSVNQIVAHQGIFRDETRGLRYTNADSFASEAWYETAPAQTGSLIANYLSYTGAPAPLACRVSRRHAAVPQQPFIVIRYEIENTSDKPTVFNVLDHIQLANVAAHDPAMAVHAWHDAQRNALVADMSASGQFVIVLGAFQAVEGFQIGNPDRRLPDATAPGTLSFESNGTLGGNADLRAANVDMAFNQRLTMTPAKSASLSFYLVIHRDLPSALAAADAARAKTAEDWFGQTASDYAAWLSNDGKGKRTQFADHGMNTMFDASLIAAKQMQNPALGTIVASTNPFAYGYKNWVRDGSIVAIALDAAGHYSEAEMYWRWMASVQGDEGSWKTTYNFWNGAYMSFVEPEFDSVGAFLYGVYRHFRTTGDSEFLNALWPAVQRAADWILRSISGANGFGAADFSIWEEPERGLQHNSFTQTWFVAGLYGAQWLAELRGDTALADWYAGGPASIMTALQRPASWQPPGAWSAGGYYARGVNADGTPAPLQDSSSNMLLALGVIDARSQRARNHMAVMLSALTKNAYGLARYQGDIYYHSSPFDPAGDEVGGIEPAWPQMSMWVSVFESLGNRDAARRRMRWFVSTAGRGYMPQGEAVSNITQLSVESSMCEPLTTSSYILAAVCHRGTFDMRVVPPIYNAGTYKPLATSFSAGNAAQWVNVPYFLGNLNALPKAAASTVNKVYACNDDAALHLRIDNAARALPAFGAAPKFAIRIYAQDFDYAAATLPWGLDREPISRPVSHVFERRSDEDTFRHWAVSGSDWAAQAPIQSVVAPQWDPASGRIEVTIPIERMRSGAQSIGEVWATLAITIATPSNAPGGWSDGNKLMLHYRLSRADQAWIFGNIEE